MKNQAIDFKKKINKIRITNPEIKYDGNNSFVAVNSFYKKDRPSLFAYNQIDNNFSSNRKNENKINYTFYESKSINNNGINKNPIRLSSFRKRNIQFEEEKHVTFEKNSLKDDLIDEYEGLGYSTINYKKNNLLKKDNLKFRFNSFHINENKYKNRTFASLSNKKEITDRNSKSNNKNYLNKESKAMKIPQIISNNTPTITKNGKNISSNAPIKNEKIISPVVPTNKNEKNITPIVPKIKIEKNNPPVTSKNEKNNLFVPKKKNIHTNGSNKEKIIRIKPKILMHEKTIKNETKNEIKNEKKLEEDDDEWNIEQYQGLRKKTLNIKRIKNSLNQKNKLNEINSLFSKNIYIKSCQATSVGGKDEDGLKKINQDTYIIERNINGVLNFNIFGVLDGHGINGHLVSQFVSRYIINRIKNHYSIKNEKIPNEIYQKLTSNGYGIIADIFYEADIQLAKQKFDCQASGTTCVIVIQLEEKIICANAGDSRAIIIYDDSNNKNLSNTKVYPLSYDCKPENPFERERIIENGGTVEQAEDENGIGVGPYRVWVKGEEYPGLAMSRCIGDLNAKKIGVIPYPQIIEYEINNQSKYMIICSDGIWEFISNEEAKNIGNKYYLRNDPIGLCHELTNKSTTIWLKEDIVIDDITVVVAFF